MSDLRGCADSIHTALLDEMRHRTQQPDWINRERAAVADAANRWAQQHQLDRAVSVADVERVETGAIGHVDYARKLAWYVAELLHRPDPHQP